MFFREGSLYEACDSVANQHWVYFAWVCWKSEAFEGMVCGIGKVGYSVEQSAVKVEYNELFHIVGI